MDDRPEKTNDPIRVDGLAVSEASAEGYLGNPDVVEGLVRGFAQDVLEKPTADEKRLVIDRMGIIFQGDHPAYPPVPGWSKREALGFELAKRYQFSPDQSFIDILRTAFTKIALALHDIAAAPGGDDEWQWKIDAEIELATAVLLGIADQTHPLKFVLAPDAPAPL